MTKISNSKRANRVSRVIAEYGEDVQGANLIDLLSDSMHWCKLNAEDFERCLRLAREHFDAETNGPDDELPAPTVKQWVTEIAREHLFIPTLERRDSDSLDFHDVAVWSVEAALTAAFAQGWCSALDELDCALAVRRQIAVLWTTDDVLEMREDLNEQQAWQVLQYCNEAYDRRVGFGWPFIDLVASDLFPEPQEGDGQ
ncbi:MAG: hypothetical protein RIC85_02365 [Gammaproteobacteria bacterium]